MARRPGCGQCDKAGEAQEKLDRGQHRFRVSYFVQIQTYHPDQSSNIGGIFSMPTQLGSFSVPAGNCLGSSFSDAHDCRENTHYIWPKKCML